MGVVSSRSLAKVAGARSTTVAVSYGKRCGSLIIGLILLCVGGASVGAAQDAPVGTYRARAVTLELTASGRAVLSNAFGPVSNASYAVSSDTILFRDESGSAACPGPLGRYLWRFHADTLRFQLLSDPCDGRRLAMATTWTRGTATTTGVAAELSSVVITAQREVEDVQRAPVSITVLSPAVLRDAGVTQPQGLTYVTPGLQVGALVGTSAILYMRGVGNFTGNSLQDPTVTFNFDGVYIARPTAAGGLFYDLERVEVLKGPQGTLYGRNATGGAINILPRRPEPGIFGGDVVAEYGTHNTVRVDGALNAPLGRRAALRIAGQRARHDAYMNDGTDDQDDWAGRLSFRFDISDELGVRMIADYYHQGGRGPGATPLALDAANRFGVTSHEGGDYYTNQRVTIAGRNWEPLPTLQYADNHHGGVNATIEWLTKLGALTLVSAHRRSRLDAIGSPAGNLLTVQEHSRQTTLEARLASTVNPRLQTLLGMFVFDEDIETKDGEFFRPWNEFNFSLQQPQTGATSTAPFARATLHVTARFRATAGVRHTRERKYFGGTYESFQRLCVPVPTASCPNAEPFPADIRTSPLVFPPGSLDAIPVFNPADGTLTVGVRIVPDESAKFSRTTWRGALEYDVSKRALLYSSIETGFKSGGFFYSNDSQVYQPEYVQALTTGYKSRLLDNRLEANIELFDWRYRDQQITKLSVDSRNVTNLRTENVGQATIRGVEAGIAYMPQASTYLAADFQYLRARYDSYQYLTPLSAGPPVSGCGVTPGPAGFLVDCSGSRSPFAPERTLSLNAAQTIPLRTGANLLARARVRHQSETLVGLDFLPQQRQGAFWTTDASFTWMAPAGRHSIGIFGQNLTDRTIVSNTFVVPFSTFAVGVLRPPRTLGVRVGSHF